MNFFTPARSDASSMFLVPSTFIDVIFESRGGHMAVEAATWNTASQPFTAFSADDFSRMLPVSRSIGRSLRVLELLEGWIPGASRGDKLLD